MAPEIKVTITKEGKIKIEVHGVAGAACEDVVKFLDQLGQVEESGHTPDYYQGVVYGQDVSVGG